MANTGARTAFVFKNSARCADSGLVLRRGTLGGADDLCRVLCNVHAALKPAATFVFDVNTSAAYGERWNHTFSEVQTDHAFILRGRFDPATQIGATEITMFRLLEGAWQRSDAAMRQRPWEFHEMEPMLLSAGFTAIGASRAVEDLGMSHHYGLGRVVVAACTKSNKPGTSSLS